MTMITSLKSQESNNQVIFFQNSQYLSSYMCLKRQQHDPNFFIYNKYLNKKNKPLYEAFVDFKKIFDSVNHTKLFTVLHNNDIQVICY